MEYVRILSVAAATWIGNVPSVIGNLISFLLTISQVSGVHTECVSTGC